MTMQTHNANHAARRKGISATSMLAAASSVAATLFLTGCDAQTNRQISALLSNAKGVTTNLAATSDVGLINNEPDYGIKISFQVQNVGDAGLITIQPWVSSSEGEWQREQKIQFAKGETRPFSYFFHEPTVNAANVQYGVKVYPGPGQ